MGNCWSRFKSSAPSIETSLPTPGNPCLHPWIPPCLREIWCLLLARIRPLSTSGDPVSPPPPTDAIKSIEEMYKKIDQKQIDWLVSFIETQLHRMNNPSEAGSSSTERWLATVSDVTKLAATTIDSIYTEAEKLSESQYAVKEIGSLMMEVMKEMREMNWVFIGLSVAAYTIESYIRVGSTENECRELLFKILELTKDVMQYGEQMPDHRENVCNAVDTIVEGAVVCLGSLKKGKFLRFWSAKTAAEQLEKTNQQLSVVRDFLGLSGGLQILKQSTMPRNLSSIVPRDFEGHKDVFLSHSGAQKNFIRQLYLDLIRENVSCFFDEDENSLPVAHEFPPRIFKAAETCKIAVLFLSKEFICSKWPMLELSAFINASAILLPIFFMISPKELSHITKDISEWQRLDSEWQKLEVSNGTRDKWKNALKKVRSIKGLIFVEGENEVTFRVKVVKEICRLLNRINPKTPQLLDFEPVGIEEQVAEVKALMDMEGAQSALAVIVCGFRGLGKSTVAASAVQSLDWSSMDFKFCWVAIDEKTSDRTSHIIKLQKYIIYNLQGVNADLQNPQEGRVRIKEALQKKSSLLFIDNVVDKDYIRDLLPKDLSSGEQTTKLRILITSREKSVKAELKIICKEYAVMSLSDAASSRLLLETIVLSEVDISLDEKHMINNVAAACRGVPLLLSVFGNHLRVARNEDSYKKDKDSYKKDKDKYPKEIYEEALGDLRKGNLDRYQDEDVGKKLMFVFDKIKDVEFQEAFLDICTYFHGWEWNLVADIVDLPKLESLRSRMLVSKSSSGVVIVHDILRLMGMNKANLTRFSNYKKLSDALENTLDGSGIGNVKGISLVQDRLITIQSTKLEAMRQSLRVLILGDWVTLEGSPSDKAFTNLRYLHVGDITVFPFKDPSKLDKLRVFLNRSKPGMNLSHLPSSLKRISHEVPNVEKSFIVKTSKSVELPKELHLPASLVDLHLTSCKNLPKDVGHLTALESLILDGSDLEHLPQGFGKLKKLKHLSMDNCLKLAFLSEERGMLSSLEALSINDWERNFRALPESFGGLISLQTLNLEGCKNLQVLPESLGGLRALQTLNLRGCINLQVLPESLGGLLALQTLNLEGCINLQLLPESLGRLLALQTLNLERCINLQVLPESLGGLLALQTLNLKGCINLQVLPESLGGLLALQRLNLEGCINLQVLPDSLGGLPALQKLELRRCINLKLLPESFGELRIQSLKLDGLEKLQDLPNSLGNMPLLKDLKLE